jgi:hypothetical protein
MTPLLHSTLWLTLALAPQDKIDPKLPDPPPAVLMSPALADELKVDAEQRKKVDALDQEFQQQRKAALNMTLLKVKTILDKIERNEEAAPALAITTAVTSSLLEVKRTQAAYEKKVMELLNADQQKKYAAWLKARPKTKTRPVTGMHEGDEARSGVTRTPGCGPCAWPGTPLGLRS